VPALDLITRFLQNMTFKDYKIPAFKSKMEKPTKTAPSTKSSGTGKVEEPIGVKVDDGVKPGVSNFWTGATMLIVAFASFGIGFYAAKAMQGRREGYEEISNHGSCELEPSTSGNE